MKIAVPIGQELTIYHDNPFTAERFAIYSIEGHQTNVQFRLSTIVENPCISLNNNFEEPHVKCSCNDEDRKDLRHICEHYSLLEAINGCSYLLADHYCENTGRSLHNAGVKIFKIPAIVNNVENAIKNFLIGASLASTIKHIHHAS